MTFPDDVITVHGTITRKQVAGNTLIVVCDTQAKDQTGDVKITGEFELEIPLG